jgi:hypothetical protein
MKKKNEDDLAKLVKLTQLLKKDNVKVAPKGPPRAPNKWRQQDPKFAAPAPKPDDANLVEAGGMKVDPSLKDEYEQWRQDKIAEQNERRDMAERRLKAKRAAYLEEATRRAKEEGEKI